MPHELEGSQPLWNPDMDPEDVAAEVRATRDNSIGYLVTHSQKVLMAAIAERLAPHGVTPAQWQALVVLWECDGIVQRDLAERISIEQATLTRTLDRMERDGFVERRRDVEDRRRVRVHVTKKGFLLINTLVPEAMNVLGQAMKGFNEAEIDQFRSFLRRLIGNLNADHPLSEQTHTQLSRGAAQ